MNPTHLDQIARFAEGTLSCGSDARVTSVCIDSRSLKAGDLFVALHGENFDGHNYVAAAAERGAAAAMVDSGFSGPLPKGFPLLRVPHTLLALQQLASNYRKSLTLRVIGITGSNGKTSTKDFLASVMDEKFTVLKTAGNLNNHIGLPLMLLRADDTHDFAILEMGLSHPGDIAQLVKIAPPDAAIITGIGVAHLEFMKTRKAIAMEKGLLAEAVPAEGIVVMPVNDAFYNSITSRTTAQNTGVGIGSGDFIAEDIQTGFDGCRFKMSHSGKSVDARIAVPGDHMVLNASLASAIGVFFGLTLEECAAGLAKAQLTGGRLQIRNVGDIRVVDDSYNANPDSVVAAIKTFSSLPTEGRRIAVLGSMAELGEETAPGYRRVGAVAAECDIDVLLAVGKDIEEMAEAARKGGVPLVVTAENLTAAAEILREMIQPGDCLLLKGSRSAGMERLVGCLETQYAAID